MSTPAAPRPPTGRSLGERLESALRSAGINKAELARRLGVRWATVHDWTTDKTAPSADHLRRIAEVIPVKLEEILGVAVGQDPPWEAWAAFLATPEGDSMTPGERRSLQAMVWPPAREPTVASYQIALASLRATKEREA